jgi:hypothetical protein
VTSATSEGAQGIFSKITFLKSVHSKEKDKACLDFLVKIFTKSVHRGGVAELRMVIQFRGFLTSAISIYRTLLTLDNTLNLLFNYQFN